MRIRLNPPADILARDGEAILLYPGEAVRVGGAGAEIVRLCSDPVPMGALARALEARFGVPEQTSVADAVAAAVAELAGRGVLIIE